MVVPKKLNKEIKLRNIRIFSNIFFRQNNIYLAYPESIDPMCSTEALREYVISVLLAFNDKAFSLPGFIAVGFLTLLPCTNSILGKLRIRTFGGLVIS